MLKLIINNKMTILFIIAIITMLLYVNRDRLNKANILRKVYAEEFDNFDIAAYKNYIKAGTYVSAYADAKVVDYVPTKTSDLVAWTDEKREESIEY